MFFEFSKAFYESIVTFLRARSKMPQKSYNPGFEVETKYWEKVIMPLLDPQIASRFVDRLTKQNKQFLDFLLENTDIENASLAEKAKLLEVTLSYKLRDSTSIISGLRNSVFSRLDGLSLDQICSILAKINKHKLPYGISPTELLPLESYIMGLTDKPKSSSQKESLQVASLNLTPSILSYLLPRTKDPSAFDKHPPSIAKTLSTCVQLLKHLSQVAETEDPHLLWTTTGEHNGQTTISTKGVKPMSITQLNNVLVLLWCLVDDFADDPVFEATVRRLFAVVAVRAEFLGQLETLVFVKCILAWESRGKPAACDNTLLERLVTSPKLAGKLSEWPDYYAYSKVLEFTKRPTGVSNSLDTADRQNRSSGLTRVNLAEQRVLEVLKEYVRVPVMAGNVTPPVLPSIPVDIMLPGVQPPTIVEVNGIHHYTSEYMRKTSTDPVLVVDAASFSQPSERLADLRGRELVRLRALTQAGYRVICIDMIAVGRGPAADRDLGQILSKIILPISGAAPKAK